MTPRLHQLRSKNPKPQPDEPRRGADICVQEGITMPERGAKHEVREQGEVQQGGDVDGVETPEVAAPRMGRQ